MAFDQYQNSYITKLRFSCTSDANVIFVDEPPIISQGKLTLEFQNQTKREIIHFTGVEGYKLTGVTRGCEDTIAQSHNTGADVRQNITAGMMDVVTRESLDTVYPVGSIFQSTSLHTVEEVSAALGGEWKLVVVDYCRIIREIHDIALDVDTQRTGDGGVGKTAVSGAYDYLLLESEKNRQVPEGYHREYNMTTEISTGRDNKVTLYINNIATNSAGTWSGTSFHNVVSTGWFKQSDIVLERTLGYTSNGCNLYFSVSGSSRWRFWKPQVIVADALNNPIYKYERIG